MVEIRKLKTGDTEKGLLEVLDHLSKTREIPPERCAEILRTYAEATGPYRILVAEEGDRIVSTARAIITWKLSRGGVKAGRISDVATHPNWEGQGIGSQLVTRLIELGRTEGCYRLGLQCSEKNVDWYKRFGFRRHDVSMRLDLG